MEFNAEKEMFTLAPEETELFRLPAGTTEWPRSNTESLLSKIALVELDLANFYPSTLSLSRADYARILAETTRKSWIARGARLVIAEHAILTQVDLDRLMGKL